jgi:hypothetical protein
MSRARVTAAALLLLTAASAWLLRPAMGIVYDKSRPVAGASVRFQGASDSVLTDRCGRFEPPPNLRNARRITAWRNGYGIGSAPAGQNPLAIQLLPLPSEDNDDYQWLDPAPDPRRPLNCGNCHAEIYREWTGSGHGRAATNPRFLAQFNQLAADRSDDIGVCSKCHAPTLRDPTLDYDLRKIEGVDRHGVHCDFCHKIVEAPTDKLGTRFGSDGYSFLRPADGRQLFFGPLNDAVREGEQFGYLPLYRQSGYCASCHEGVIYGVHVYGTYSEWLASPARREGKQCQTCHMNPTGTLTNIAPGKGGVERDPATLASHALPGGTLEMLRRCLSVKASMSGKRVDVEVLAAGVGHRVPTGFIDRNLILVLEAFDREGRPVKLADGRILPKMAGNLAGKPGKIYAKRLVWPNSHEPIRFWQPHEEVIDNRLWPGAPDQTRFEFATEVSTLRLRLHYQRFWLAGESVVVCDVTDRHRH